MDNTVSPITLNELLHFFPFAEEKGLLKPNTARSNKAVVMRVCAVLDSDEQNHIDRIPPEEIFSRFKTKFASDLSHESLRVYKSRFLSALESFKAWREEEAKSKGHHPEHGHDDQPLLVENLRKLPSGKRLVLADIPVAMIDGSQVKIVNLPQDLSHKEAERIKRVIDAYVRAI